MSNCLNSVHKHLKCLGSTAVPPSTVFLVHSPSLVVEVGHVVWYVRYALEPGAQAAAGRGYEADACEAAVPS